jgi:polysaccharide export outer membrane protein
VLHFHPGTWQTFDQPCGGGYLGKSGALGSDSLKLLGSYCLESDILEANMRHWAIWFGTALLAMSVLCGGALAQQSNGSGKGTVTGKNGAERRPPAAIDDPLYLIGAEDLLYINVWKEPEISRPVVVRPDGKISLPLLNDVTAAGLTPMELEQQLTAKFQKFLTDPQVTVIVTTINSQQVFILGEVNRMGRYPLSPNMTVLQALSMSGGFTQFANLGDIYVLRKENGKQVRLPFNYKEVVRGRHSEENIVLEPGDTIVVP